jgi:predicted RNase H-like HicB family nuclease
MQVTTMPDIEMRIEELLARPIRKVICGDPTEGYLAEAPELPGCITAGETETEALQNLREAMAAWFESMLAHGEPIPEPETWIATRRTG